MASDDFVAYLGIYFMFEWTWPYLFDEDVNGIINYLAIIVMFIECPL